MADVGLGQLATLTGRYRSKVLKEAVKDNHPLYATMDQVGGIVRIDGGRTVLDESLSGQNGTVNWVGEAGTVSIQDYKVADSPEFEWKYQLGAVTWTMAERLQNSGSSKYIDIVSAKFQALEASMMNEFHEGMLSAGTGSAGLQLNGAASLVSTTPTTGTVGGINRASADAAWYRNQKFDTASDWSEGAVNAGNAKRFLDKLINSTMKNSKPQLDAIFAGATHFEFITQAINAIQVIQNESKAGKAGFDHLYYRGVPVHFGGGVNYSGASAMTATRTYGFNFKPGGVNLVFHKQAEFDMLEQVASQDQAAVSRLMFTMACMKVGAFSKLNIVGFD